MDLGLTEEQKMIKNNVRRFLEKEIHPLVEEYETKSIPIGKDIIKKVLPFGYIGGLLPEEVGGAGLDHVTYFMMIEEMSRVWPSLRAIVSNSNLILTDIYESGTEQQKEKYVEPLMEANKIGFFALTEPNAGSDTSSIEMSAVLKGDHWVLNGTKMFITSGQIADMGILFARTDKTKGSKGITAFIINHDETEYKARAIEKMGMHSNPTAELFFEDSLVPKENVLGEIGEGLKLAGKMLNFARALVSFICTGVAQACVDAAIKYAKERVQFGKPIGGFQLIQAHIADMLTMTSAMRLLGLQAADLLDKGLPCQRECSMAKLYASEKVLQVAEKAMQVHGGYGYSREFPVERYYRDIRHFTCAEGTSEIQRLMIGRDALGISAIR